MKRSTSISILMLVLLFATPILAQFTTARVNGTVADASGAALAGSTITIEQVATRFTRSTTSGALGEFLFPALPVGQYQVTVTLKGFRTYTQQGVTLATNQSVTLPIQLQVGSVDEKLMVTANASLVTTDSATVGQLISQKDIVELPLSNRYVQQLVFLVPGAQNVTASYCAANCEGGVFPSEQYAKLNGAGANGVSYQLDGGDYNDNYINTNLPFPNPDAIQDFSVLTTNMSAVYGDAIGGVVNISLKSGTNAIHGGLFEFYQNDRFNAKNWFAQSASPLNQNQFGGYIGGPILKDKLFYFGSYQGTRFNAANNGQGAYVPNAAERTGDFSDIAPGSPICQPFGTCVQLADPVTGAPYLNNQVPVSPVAAFLLSKIPLPNGDQLGIPGPAGLPNDNLYYNGLPIVQNTNEYLGKLDFNFAKNHLSGHYFQLNYTQPLVLPPSTNILETESSAETLLDKNVSIVDIYTITPSIMLGSYYGLTKIDGTTFSGAPFSPVDAGVNIALPQSSAAGFKPSLSFSTNSFGVGSNNYGVFNRGVQSLREIATITKGNHLVQVGGQFIRVTQPMANMFQEGANFIFGSSFTGYNLADFVSGKMSTFIQGGGLYLDFKGINWSAFVQDDWKATPRFTISAGLRWDPFIPSKDSLGRVACFEVGAAGSVRYPNAPPDLLFGGPNHDAGCPDAGIFASYNNYGPRFGFSYQATQDGKTSLRGGVGYYYEPPNSLIYQQIVGVPPFAPVVSLQGILDVADPYGSAGVADPFPAEFGPRNPGPDATFPTGAGAISFSQLQDPHLRLPMVLTYNLTLEQGVGPDGLLRIAFVGNNGHHLYGTGDQESGLLQVNPAVYIPGASTEDATNIQSRRLLNQKYGVNNYGSVAEINSGVNSNYNALQVSVEKRLSHGYSFLSSFTWAKAMDDFAPSKDSPQYTNSCACGRHFDYGPSDDDLNKVIKFNVNYLTPTLHVHGIEDKLLNGWEITGIVSWYPTGTPFTIISGVDNSFSAIGADRADLVNVSNIEQAKLGHRPHPGVVGQWINPADFAPNAIGTYGNIGKNGLRSPGFFDSDVSVIKNAKFKQLALELRADIFNATNHPNFGAPDNNQSSSGFGQIGGTLGSNAYGGNTSYGTAQPRIMQFGVKATF
jgi:hypothetical protein